MWPCRTVAVGQPLPLLTRFPLTHRVASGSCEEISFMGRAIGLGSRRLVAAFLALAAAIVAVGQGAANGEHGKLLTPEASLNLRSVSELQFSPGGARLAFEVAGPPKGAGRVEHISI